MTNLALRTKPTRRDLLLVIGHLQDIIGEIRGAAGDRNPDRAADIARLTMQGHKLCIEARSFDPPIEGGSKRGWSKP